jgi:hypothetical protein
MYFFFFIKFFQNDHTKKGKIIDVEEVITEEAKNDCLGIHLLSLIKSNETV